MRTVITGAQVFDTVSGEVSGADVAFEDGLISEVGSGLQGDEQFDATGLTVLPGLIDTHVHVMLPTFDVVSLLEMPFSYFFYAAMTALGKTMDAGITYVRDANGADEGLRKAVGDDLVDGPDLHISIQALSQNRRPR